MQVAEPQSLLWIWVLSIQMIQLVWAKIKSLQSWLLVRMLTLAHIVYTCTYSFTDIHIAHREFPFITLLMIKLAVPHPKKGELIFLSWVAHLRSPKGFYILAHNFTQTHTLHLVILARTYAAQIVYTCTYPNTNIHIQTQTLGNHDFDFGTEELGKYLDHLKHPGKKLLYL
jgi:hypothetical protein